MALLYPLDRFCDGKAPPRARPLAPDELPEPYRQLLAHERDMTPTLEAYHGEPIRLRLLERRMLGDSLARHVLLVLTGSGRCVEYGAIVIHRRRFPAEAIAAIDGCELPLGTIMAQHRMAHASRPEAFFCLEPDPAACAALGLADPVPLYGRKNRILDAAGEPLAEVVEILPPLAEAGRRSE